MDRTRSSAPRGRRLAPAGVLAGLLLAAAAAPAPLHAARAVRLTLPPLAVRLHEDSLRFVAGVTAAKFDSLNAAFVRDIADARKERNEFVLGRLLTMQGAGYALVGRPIQAAPPLDEAIPLAEAQNDTLWLLITLRWRAYTAGNLGHIDEQERFAERLVAVAEADSNRKFLAIGNNFLGWIARQRGDLKRARVFLERSVEGHRALHADGDEAFARMAYGATLMDLGEYAAARRSYARQIELARRLHQDWTVAQAYNDLSVLEHQVGDPGRGVEYARRAYETLRQRGETLDAIGALMNLGAAELQLGRAAGACDLARDGLAVCERRGFARMRGSLLDLIGNAEEAQGHDDAALAAYRRVVALGDSVPPDGRAVALMGVSRALRQQGHTDEALALIDREAPALLPRLSREDAARLQVGWGSRMWSAGRHADAVTLARRMIAEPDFGRYESTPTAWALLAAAQHSLGRSEDARAAYDSACVAWERFRGRPADPQWRASNWSSPGSLTHANVELLLRWPANASESARIGAAFDRLQRFRSRTLLERMSARGATAAGATTMTAEAVQDRLLGEHELLLEWMLDDRWDHLRTGNAFLFAFTRDQRRVFDLGDTRALRAKIATARELFSSVPRGASDRAAREAVQAELARVVFGPAMSMVERAKSVIVVPDGELHQVPFAALTLKSGPLIAGRSIAVAPSVAVLAEARAHGGRSDRTLLVVSTAKAGSQLSGVRREVDWLATAFEGVQRSDPQPVSTEAFASSLVRYGAIHFAGHTVLDDRFPWRSGIDVGVAAAADPIEDSGFTGTRGAATGRELLRAETIAASRLSAGLVVLSSCETAAGQIVAGEGVAGLSTAFIAAGAHTVVASLWPVDDRATEALMREFYRGLAAGETAAASLRAAQDRLRHGRDTAHPYYWAGFEVIGDGRTTLPLTPAPLWKRVLGGKSLGGLMPEAPSRGSAGAPGL